MNDVERALKIGSLWADNDPRAVGRVVEVIEFLYSAVFPDGSRLCTDVRVRVVQNRRRYCLRSSVGRETWISIERLLIVSKNRGYRPIKSLDEA